MADNNLQKGAVLYESGQPMSALHLITSGKVTVTYPGGTYNLGKGDVIGVCEICSEVHFLTYTAAEDSNIITYPFRNMAMLDNLLKKNADMARLFIMSACYQINTLLERCSVSELDCNSLHQTLLEDYETYNQLSTRYRMKARSLNNWESLTAYLGEESPDLWLAEYYLGLARIYSGDTTKLVIQESAVSSGLLRKCSLDFRKAYTVLDEQFNYLQQLSSYYFNKSGNDLFDFFTSLYYKLGADCEENDSVYSIINRIILKFGTDVGSDSTLFDQRIAAFEQNLNLLQTTVDDPATPEDEVEVVAELVGSLNTILEYAGSAFEDADSFRQHVHSYKSLEDKFATDDEVVRLRAILTREFHKLYAILFERTLGTPTIPAPVRMFLYFGYVDEELAGSANAVYLYNMLDTMSDHSAQGVYTFYDWLLAIYHGKKEPSRSEFDQDFTDHIHKLRANGNTPEAEIKALEKNPMAKVNYELQNLFPSVNKITYGRITIYCPLFCAENVLKSLDESYVTVTDVSKAIEQIKKIDYSVFYRESMDKDNLNVLGKEQLHFEYLPDVILMPNVGIRGSMWQEIEGKRRTSPGRMLFSIFHMEDINLTMIRLAGEFRWELCKRIQGSRWNDVSEPSLTSEYFDYIQFYRKNHELTAEAKERVRSGLQRAKNSFKEMFVRDYIVWVMFEGNGSPRLNKVARRIMLTYCPFPKEIRETLTQNPLYTELMAPIDLKRAQRLHHLKALTKKLQNSGIRIPESLEREALYVDGTINS